MNDEGVLGRLRSIVSSELATTAFWRLLVMVIGFATTASTTATLVRQHGADGFATFSLLSSLLLLLPFLDLGLGTGVVNATTDLTHGRVNSNTYGQLLRVSLRILIVVAAVLIALAVIACITGTWRAYFGSLASQPATLPCAFAVLAALALAIPLTLASRVMQGLGEIALLTKMSLVGAGIQATALVVNLGTDSPAAAYAFGPSLGLIATSLTTTIYALRSIGPGTFKWRGPARFPARYTPVGSALPTLLTLVASVAGLQLDRPLLIQVSTPGEVASYSYIAQFLIPLYSVITLMSLNLWPRYRLMRAEGSFRPQQITKDSAIFLLLGIGASTVLVLGSLCLAPLLTAGDIEVSPALEVAAAALLIVLAGCRPAAMALSDTRGLWAQAVTALIMAASNVVLTLHLGRALGAQGAFLASTLAVLSTQFLPLLAYISRACSGRR